MHFSILSRIVCLLLIPIIAITLKENVSLVLVSHVMNSYCTNTLSDNLMRLFCEQLVIKFTTAVRFHLHHIIIQHAQELVLFPFISIFFFFFARESISGFCTVYICVVVCSGKMPQNISHRQHCIFPFWPWMNAAPHFRMLDSISVVIAICFLLEYPLTGCIYANSHRRWTLFFFTFSHTIWKIFCLQQILGE